MSHLLFRLRHVTDDEADEVRQLLQKNDIEFYETGAGFFGTGIAAIWLADRAKLEFARTLIKQYQIERRDSVRCQHQAERDAGEHDTLFKKIRREPIKMIVAFVVIGFILYLSLMPFFRLQP